MLLQASEREFWENFCKGVGRARALRGQPGRQVRRPRRGQRRAARRSSRRSSSPSTAKEWVDLGLEINVPIINVNTPQTLADDPQFQARFPWIPAERLGAEQLPSPIKYLDIDVPVPTKAPTVGQHTDEVLRDVLGYDDAQIADLREHRRPRLTPPRTRTR